MLQVKPYIVGYCLLLFLTGNLIARENTRFGGSRSAALSGATTTIDGLWAQVNNQAAMAGIEKYSLAVHYENRFGIDPLSLRSLLFAMPLLKGAWGINYAYFGDTPLNEQQISTSFAYQLTPILSVGAAAGYYQIKSEVEQSTTQHAMADIGLIAQLNKNLRLGFHCANLNHAGSEPGNNLAPETNIGIGVSYSQKYFALTPEVVYNFHSTTHTLVGLELYPSDNLHLRFGIAADEDLSYSFGLGYSMKGLTLDFAFARDPYLGFSPYVSLSYQFKN